jgi:Hemerythrin HHE cation binding domain
MPNTDELRSGDMNDVNALVANDHAYLRQLLDEATRASDTPGVRRDLVQQAGSAWATHSAAEEAVLYPEAITLIGAEPVERAARVQHVLDRLMADLRGEATGEQLSAVDQLLGEHVKLVETEILVPLLDRAPDRLGELAARWAQATEAASGLTRPAD